MEAGRILAHYELVARIGKGGMGEVWRARDTRLGRDVALKVLPSEFTGDEERVRRFQREARVLAALNHPHVAQVFGADQVGDVCFIAMELVGGESLAEVLRREGSAGLPLEESLRVARQIAEGLEAAHEAGIVHRDLKPANVALAGDGTVKVLDFGLAKATGTDPGSGPTVALQGDSVSLSREGQILGTPTYMSPEQARGRKTDKRTDIWAFGCVLFECLTGSKTFTGETVTDVLGAIVHREPDWSRLPKGTPPGVRDLLRRCLEKDPRLRMRDIGEARLLLSGSGPAAGAADEHHVARSPLRGLAIVALATGLAIAATLFVERSLTRPPEPAPVRRFDITIGEPGSSASIAPAISPDGRRVAYVADRQLWIRDIDAVEPRPVPDTGHAGRPFWSPDGQQLGFRDDSTVYRLPVAGGGQRARVASMELTGAGGACWGDDGWIVLSNGRTGTPLQRVSAAGGDAVTVLEADKAAGYTDFHTPSVLPDGRGALFALHTTDGIDTLAAWDARSGARTPKVLLELAGANLERPVWSDTGHVLYERHGVNEGVWALPVSLDRLEAMGEPFLVVANASNPTVARDGTLVVLVGREHRLSRLVWVERDGTVAGTICEHQEGACFPSLSPDGRFVAVSANEGDRRDIWVHDTERGTRKRLTFTQDEEEWWAVWTPDGRELAYVYATEGASALSGHIQRADGSDAPRAFVDGAPTGFTPDGRSVLYFVGWETDVGAQLYVRAVSADAPAIRILDTQVGVSNPVVSPDGCLLAYQSEESGRGEVYLTSFPDAQGKWQVSSGGGYLPHWNATSDELYYVSQDDALMVVDVSPKPELNLGPPRQLFAALPTGIDLDVGFDVRADGQRFVAVQGGAAGDDERRIRVIQNWFSEFERR